MSPANCVVILGRGATGFTIRSNRGCYKGSFGVEEDKDVASFVHAEDSADNVGLASMGQIGLSYFHQAIYDTVLERSEEDKPTCLSLLQRLCVMGPRLIGPNILLSLEIPTRGGDIKCSGGICTSIIEHLLEEKIGQSTIEVVPTVGGGALSPTTVKDGESNRE
ncbi:hypothetical protein SUGI_1126480 [Cryptomeria japonica]|nr:hypothetical protein SUGI_1126480 [Cryptomeria japonica]